MKRILLTTIILLCFLTIGKAYGQTEEEKKALNKFLETSIQYDDENEEIPNWQRIIPKAVSIEKFWEIIGNEYHGVKVINGNIQEIIWMEKRLCGTIEITNALPELTYLNCSKNRLKALNVSGALKLEKITCDRNEQITLNFTGDTELTELHCNDNQLNTLNVLGLKKLKKLDCFNNQLTNLDVSELKELESLSCSNNQLINLDVSELKNLKRLTCGNNLLTNLDVSELKKLQWLLCSGNQLTSLDVSENKYLGTLWCESNKLTTLNINRSANIEDLKCQNNQLTALDVSEFKYLSYFHCNNNQLTDADFKLPESELKYKNFLCYENELSPTFIARIERDLPESTNVEGVRNFVYTPQNYSTIPPVTYQTLTLDVAEGLGCNFSAGSLTVQNGDHLHLLFYPTLNGYTLDDVLFTIDGREVGFNNSNGSGSYIINPVLSDHTIQIAMKEYELTLPETDGSAAFDLAPGTHRIAYGQPFSFTLTLPDTQDPASIRVLANGEELSPVPLRATTLAYTIEKVTGPIRITVEGLDPVGNLTPTSLIRCYSRDGQLVIETSSPQAVQVYSITGVQQINRTVNGCETFSLPKGSYIVKCASNSHKVLVK